MGKGKRNRKKKKNNSQKKKKKVHLHYSTETPQEESFSWLQKGLLCIAGAVMLGGGGYAINQSLDGTPNHAPSTVQKQIIQHKARDVREVNQRQTYLDNLLVDADMPYCSGVVYDHDGSKILRNLRSLLTEAVQEPTWPGNETVDELVNSFKPHFAGGRYDAKTPEVITLNGQGRKSKIFIGRDIFEKREWNYITDNDLKHIIIVHEYHHAKQIAEGYRFFSSEKLIDGIVSGKIRNSFISEIAELDANYYGLKAIQSGEFNVSDAHYEMTKKQFLSNFGVLMKKAMPIAKPLEREFITSAIENTRGLKIR